MPCSSASSGCRPRRRGSRTSHRICGSGGLSPTRRFSHPDRYGIHNAPAVRGSVARLDIDVQAREAIRAVISVLAARALRHYSASAHPANKSFVAGVSLIITFFVLFAFVFAIHFSSRGLSCGRTAECVLFADLPVSARSPVIL